MTPTAISRTLEVMLCVDDVVVAEDPGGQVRSLLSLISYFGRGENRERYLGVKIPPTNLKPDALEQARAFAAGLADRLPSEDRIAPQLSTREYNQQPTDATKAATQEGQPGC